MLNPVNAFGQETVFLIASTDEQIMGFFFVQWVLQLL